MKHKVFSCKIQKLHISMRKKIRTQRKIKIKSWKAYDKGKKKCPLMDITEHVETEKRDWNKRVDLPKARWYFLSDVYWMFLDSFLLIKVTQKFPHISPFFPFIHVWKWQCQWKWKFPWNIAKCKELAFVCNFRLICAHHINMKDSSLRLAIMIDLIRVWQLRDIFFSRLLSFADA